MKKILIVLLIGVCQTVAAQKISINEVESDERATIQDFSGLQYTTKDSTFYINFRFRMQNRLGFHSFSGNNLGIERVDALVRRLRWRIDGFIMSQRLTYSIQLSFARPDTDFENSGFANIVRDAVIFYEFHRKFYVAFGQNKLPGNRQRVVSSGQLQFADRSIVNSTFTLDRDFGIKMYYEDMVGNIPFSLKGAISTGEGRSVNFTDNGLAYTIRGEVLPLGNFSRSGDYSEGDLEREQSPKLSIGGGYHYNHKAKRTGGQLGIELFGSRNFQTYFMDILFKYRGLAYSAEFMKRNSDNPVTVNENDDVRYIYTGYGINQQFSYLFVKNYELAFRYSYLTPDNLVNQFEKRQDILEVGATKYIVRHRVKLQWNVFYNVRDGNFKPENNLNRWGTLLQIELGI
jgi:phosphate-selective porin OprO and OprP